MRVGIVSDSHGSYGLLLQALHEMGPIDLLVHAGDGAWEMAKLLRERTIPCRQVAGNCDQAGSLPEEMVFEIGHWKVLLTHGHRYGVKQGLLRLALQGQKEGADLVIFGHTHIPYREEHNGIRLFNPGALSAQRCVGRPTYGIIELAEDNIRSMVNVLG